MNGLLTNPVIQGLLAGGPNAIRMASEQQRAALAPRGGGGMSGAPGAIVTRDTGMADLGSGLSGLGEGLAAIGAMRDRAAQKEAFDAAIATLPPEQQTIARLNPEAFAKAYAEAMSRPPEKMTTANTALFDVDGKPRRMALDAGMKAGLPEWQDPPDMKTFGNDAVGYYALKQTPGGGFEKIDLLKGLGREPKQVQTVTTAEGVFPINPDATLGPRLGSPVTSAKPETIKLFKGGKEQTVTSGTVTEKALRDAGWTTDPAPDPTALQRDYEYAKANGGYTGTFEEYVLGADPQKALAAFKLKQEQGNTERQVVSQYEDLTNLIRQGELVLDHPGRGKGTGMSRTLFAPFGVTIPGSDTAGFDAQLETLKAKVFLPEVQKMQGMGALSNAEGQKISAAFGALDPNMPDDEFAKTLNTALSDLRRAQERAAGRLPQGYGNSPASAPAAAPTASGGGDPGSPPEGVTPDEWKYMTPEEKALFQ